MFVWTLFVKALHFSKSSLSATLMSASTNYIFSVGAFTSVINVWLRLRCLTFQVVCGMLLFSEVTSLLGWSGMALIFLGLILIVNEQKQ